MSLLKLKSIFSPTNTKFEKSDLTTFPRQFDNDFQQTNLQNIDSIFSPTNTKFEKSDLTTFSRQFDNDFQQTNLQNINSIFGPDGNDMSSQGIDDETSTFRNETINKSNTFVSNRVNDMFDSNLFFDNTIFFTHNNEFGTTPPIDVNAPILDSVLRGRVYEQNRFSTNFTIENGFVLPERGIAENQLFKDQTFDPRFTTPKERTLYFNTNNSFNPATNPTDFSTAGFNGEQGGLPFTPLTELGGQFKENLSWENLYNSNHTPKDNPTYKDKPVISYGPNVNRDKLKIGTQGLESTLFAGIEQLIDGSIKDFIGDGRGTEPYIVSPIGNEGRDINGGSRFLPFSRAKTDFDRITNFLKTPSGISFLVKQNASAFIKTPVVRKKTGGLERVTQRFNQYLNPISLLGAGGSRALGEQATNIKFRKGELPILGEIFGLDGTYSANVVNKTSINDTFTRHESTNPDEPGFLSQLGSTLNNLNPFSDGVDVPRYSSGDKMTLAEMITGDSLDILKQDDSGNYGTGINADGIAKGIGNKTNKILKSAKAKLGVSTGTIGATDQNQLSIDVEAEEHGMPFYFKDLRDNKYIIFRAYIESLNETIAPTFTPHNYIGRSEPVHVYDNATREINMGLKLAAQTKAELLLIYQKMNKLTSLCYPEYEPDKYGNRMKPPLMKLRYGELYGKRNSELMGILKSLSYTVDNTSPYETQEQFRVPRHVLVNFTYQVIHDKTPNKNTKFYGIYGV